MLAMPKPKKRQPAPLPPGPPPEADPPAKKQPNRTGKPINVWVPDELHAAVFRFMKAQRVEPKLTDVVELALQEFLQREKFWPPADTAD